MLPNLSTTEYVNLVTDPYKEGVIYISFNGSGLFRSTDSGSTFTTLSSVSAARLCAVGKAGESGNTTLFIYGKVNNVEGAFRSTDNGISWIEISTPDFQMGMEPNIMAADRNVFGCVFIGTNGNGAFIGEPENTTPNKTQHQKSEKLKNNVSIYPNPVKRGESVYLKTNNTVDYELYIFQHNGKIIGKSRINGFAQINTDYLNPGLFLFKLINEEENISKKLIVN